MEKGKRIFAIALTIVLSLAIIPITNVSAAKKSNLIRKKHRANQ